MSAAPVDPENSRNHVYREILEDINASGQCPFCPGGYTWKNQEILRESGDWTISLVDPRYALENTAQHFLLFPRRHLEDADALTAADWAAIHELTSWARHTYDMPGSVLTMRSGDTRYTGGSVRHLHAQFFIGKEVNGTPQLVTCYFGPFKKSTPSS